jgi:hypothetical protein
MGYGLTAVLLVQPGAAGWRPAPDPEAPAVRKALELARGGRELTHEETMEIGSIPAITVYHHTLRPDQLEAPAPWPQELALMLAESVLAAFGEGMRTWRSALLRGPFLTAGGMALAAVRRRAERAHARRLGLTALTAPQRSVTAHMVVLLVAAHVYWLLRATGRASRPQRLPWALLAAKDAIRRFDERSRWRRAYAAAAARSPQACSSAESSTSGGWAPETP